MEAQGADVGSKFGKAIRSLPRPTRIKDGPESVAAETPTKAKASPVKRFQITPNTRDKIIEIEKYQSGELSRLQKDVAARRHEVESLKNKMMQLTTLNQELELNQEILHAKFYNSAKIAASKESDLDSLDSSIQAEIENLQKTADLHKRELHMNHQQSLTKLTRTFEDKVDQTLKNKVKLLKLERTNLSQELESLKTQIDDIEQTASAKKCQLKAKYGTKLSEISNMVNGMKTTLDDELQSLDEEIANASGKLRHLNSDELDTLEKENVDLRAQITNHDGKSAAAEERYRTLTATITSLEAESKSLDSRIAQAQDETESFKRKAAVVDETFETEQFKRRHLNNLLQDLKGNIRVFCRMRPALPKETGMDIADIEFPRNAGESNTDQIVLKDNRKTNKRHVFQFDKVFDMNSTSGEIFEEISPLIQSCINGYRICLFAYGQTGSGKTYTMSEPNVGMIPRTVHQIFDDIANLSNLQKQPWEYKVTGQFLEIYNENIIDLISESYDASRRHEIRHDQASNKTSITGLTEVELTDSHAVNRMLAKANRNRSTASTKANERSSRSHSIFILRITGTDVDSGATTEGILNLVDLAGSERLANSQASGDRLKETQAINKSLSSLGDVIAALKDKAGSGHIPFRNSKLTYLLQNSLTGNSKTLMFVNVSPMTSHFNETVNSLRFAMKVNNTRLV